MFHPFYWIKRKLKVVDIANLLNWIWTCVFDERNFFLSCVDEHPTALDVVFFDELEMVQQN
jgi:hypothetical protein